MTPVIFKHQRVTERRPLSSESKRQQESAATARLVREAGAVRALEVTCACGEHITIELSYEAEQPAEAPQRAV